MNVAAALIAFAVLAALFSPIADPARIAVADQMRRLKAGVVAPEAFDYRYLKRDGARFGREALERLTHSADRVIADHAQAEERGRRNVEGRTRATPQRVRASIRVHPAGRVFPETFLTTFTRAAEADYTIERCAEGAGCEAVIIDLDSDGAEEIIIHSGITTALYQTDSNDVWRNAANFDTSCPKQPELEELRLGRVATALTDEWDLRFGDGQIAPRLRRQTCPDGAD